MIAMEHWRNLSLDNLAEEIDGVIRIEEWKPIWGYGGMYLISSFGRVKSAGCINHREKIKAQRSPKNIYLLVSLWKNNKEIKALVHRLVAKAFIPNPLKKKTVNHKKGIKTDARAWELEWNTHSENTYHAFRELGVPGYVRKKGANHFAAKKTIQLTKSGVEVARFGSLSEAAVSVNATPSHISSACLGRSKTARGFKWKYE